MKRFVVQSCLVLSLGFLVAPADAELPAPKLPTLEEARGRARLLHEAMHATLQIVHHQYYREDEGLQLPAATLKDVFRDVAEREKVKLRWLVVDGQAMNVEHEAKNDFEKKAAAALKAGKEEFELVDGSTLLRAGAVRLGSDCLKCHLPNRKSNEARTAGLIISMPLAK